MQAAPPAPAEAAGHSYSGPSSPLEPVLPCTSFSRTRPPQHPRLGAGGTGLPLLLFSIAGSLCPVVAPVSDSPGIGFPVKGRSLND
ncbi:hypothetical protein NDU88_003648 [Pleurodeles waltl]|uniref:Uncharacterized protein n=1 Tax=Pleurodeles waltl TaxID=8319 RepID=A0AAV7LFX3_PLEWA|nr:hypothetical protein NDU88_003648 [Pleurodeles waltl]